MEKITPRWEWRMFGAPPASTDAALAALESTGSKDSDELYLLGPVDRVVKVRDELMDVKTLVETDAHGLQRWTPVLKATFPMQDEEVEQVCEALGVASLPPRAEGYAQADFVAELARIAPAVVAAPVHKHRVRYVIEGCTAEDSLATIDGRPVRTIAIESEDSAAVLAAVRAVGLGGYRNTSYARGLAALLRAEPARFAVIDVGTNSVKLHIGERDAGGAWRTVADRAEVTRLGEGLTDSGVISAEALGRTADAIAEMAEEARSLDVTAIAAVGTAGLRQAQDVKPVLDAIEARSRDPRRSHQRRGGESSRLPRRGARARTRPGQPGGLR